MDKDIIELGGEIISSSQLRGYRSKEFLEALETNRFSRLLKVLRSDKGNEIIVFETEVEVPQHPVNDIRKNETIGVSFEIADQSMPKVYALRTNFPMLPHQLLEVEERPRSLCLYNIAYEEIKIFWTGFIFLERIRQWLKLSAIGKLHQDDQPLEPLIVSNDGSILLDVPFIDGECYIYWLGQDYNNKLTLVATGNKARVNGSTFPAQFEYLTGEPQVHGIIKKSPENLKELSDLLGEAAIDLVSYIKNKLLQYKSEGRDLKKRLLFVVNLPKIRDEKSKEKVSDFFVFLTSSTLEEMGKQLNLWADVDGNLGLGIVIGQSVNEKALVEVGVGILSPVLPFIQDTANHVNGFTSPKRDSVILAVGAGALGSQVVLNLVRAGVGKWKVIDSDIIYPHNLSRSSYLGFDIMKPKGEQLAIQANSIINNTAEAIFKNIISDKDDPEVKLAIKEAAFVLDMSASTAALKSLVDQRVNARICSLFLNPSGTDVVCIAEDAKLEYVATNLEIQYLRFILNERSLNDHFSKEGETIRYSAGCRDISLILPQDSIAIAAGLSSKAVKQLLNRDEASIQIWRTNPETLDISKYNVQLYRPTEVVLGEWKIIYDEYVMDKIFKERGAKLPNETGGVLIGTYDMLRKIIFVTEVISSPEDSYEYPTAYIRGIKNIESDLNRIREVTAGGLQYIGEWHTHPDGCGTSMSEDDLKLFKWLKENMLIEGLPALMLIAGTNNHYSYYIS